MQQHRGQCQVQILLNKNLTIDIDLGLWLLKGEERCQRSGDLRMRLEYEKIRVLEQMEVRAKMDHVNRIRLDVRLTRDRGMPSQDAAKNMDLGRGLATLRAVPDQDGTVCERPEGAGARHPSKKPNTRSGLEGGVPMNQGVATTERSVPIQDPIELEGGGARHPRNKPNTQSGLEGSVVMDKRVARKRAVPNHAEYKLTSYAAWWHRVEKLGTKFYKEVRRDEEKRRKMIDEKEKRQGKFCKEILPKL